MVEYPAMIYKNRTKGYIANCLSKNFLGFGKTEAEALENLKESLLSLNEKGEFILKPMYGLSI